MVPFRVGVAALSGCFDSKETQNAQTTQKDAETAKALLFYSSFWAFSAFCVSLLLPRTDREISLPETIAIPFVATLHRAGSRLAPLARNDTLITDRMPRDLQEHVFQRGQHGAEIGVPHAFVPEIANDLGDEVLARAVNR